MRLRQLALLMPVILIAAGAPSAAADGTFPYTAFVTEDDVYVRSGPGKNYYPTDKLQRGDSVEVYRHDPGGWFAVRPPEGSFTWVAGDFVEPVEDDVAEITGDRVVARVGSSFSDIREVIQVRLDRGERVRVLEAKRFGSGPAARTWYRIEPPAGEFRWIAGKLIDAQPPESRPRDPETSRNLIIDKISNRGDDSAATEDERSDDYPLDTSSADQRSARSDAAGPLDEDDRNGRSSSEREDVSETQVGHDSREPAAAKRDRRAMSPPTRAMPLAEQLKELNLSLSVMVAEEPSVWDFSELRRQAETALDRSETAIERGRARLILNKIKRFAEIRGRYQELAQLQAETDTRNRRLANAARATGVPRGRYDSQHTYDGSGILTRVVSSRTGSPRYALLDQNGGVRYYVTPTPGVNLRHYEGRNVGVRGWRGYEADLNAPHLTARRLTVLDGQTIR